MLEDLRLLARERSVRSVRLSRVVHASAESFRRASRGEDAFVTSGESAHRDRCKIASEPHVIVLIVIAAGDAAWQSADELC